MLGGGVGAAIPARRPSAGEGDGVGDGGREGDDGHRRRAEALHSLSAEAKSVRAAQSHFQS